MSKICMLFMMSIILLSCKTTDESNYRSSINVQPDYDYQIYHSFYYVVDTTKQEFKDELKIFANCSAGLDGSSEYSKDSLYFQIEKKFDNDTIRIWHSVRKIFDKVVKTLPELGFATDFVIKNPNDNNQYYVQMNGGKIIKFFLSDNPYLIFINIEYDKELKSLEIELTKHVPFYW